MQKDKQELTIGVLDIYGFEIFMVSCWHLPLYLCINSLLSKRFSPGLLCIKYSTVIVTVSDIYGKDGFSKK